VDALLSIGRFARLSGLSIGALRLVAGDPAGATRWAARARTALAAVADADDREPIEQDLAGLGVG
jgi:hypothetical protein